MKLKEDSIKYEHFKEAESSHDQEFEILLEDEQKTCVFHSQKNIQLDIQSIIKFGGKSWTCIGAISNSHESFFRFNNNWYRCSVEKQQPELCTEFLIKNSLLAVYDETNINTTTYEEAFCYIGKELHKIKDKTPKKKQNMNDYYHKNEETIKQKKRTLQGQRGNH